MDPYHLLIPLNRLLPAPTATQVPIARCGCGVYGCGETDIVITATDSMVRWEWLKATPGLTRSEFQRDRYVAEVARAASDTSWETLERTAGRLVLTGLMDVLPLGLRPDWIGNYWRDENMSRVCLRFDELYQIFIDFHWNGRTPEELAYEAIKEVTATPPEAWRASWHSIEGTSDPPLIAGPVWSRARVP